MSSGAAVCETYEQFLQLALKTYYEKGGKNARVGFVAMLLASAEAWKVAASELKEAATARNLAAGAAGAFALRLLLKHVVGGPIGIVLTGASVASLVALYVRNHERIMHRVERYKKLIVEHRGPFEDVQRDWRAGKASDFQRDLMVEGLLKRFLDAIDRVEAEERGGTGKTSARDEADRDDASREDQPDEE